MLSSSLGFDCRNIYGVWSGGQPFSCEVLSRFILLRSTQLNGGNHVAGPFISGSPVAFSSLFLSFPVLLFKLSFSIYPISSFSPFLERERKKHWFINPERERVRVRMGSSSGQSSGYDLSFKVLLIGDSGVGKSSLLVSFISSSVVDLSPTIGVDFKIKQLTIGGKRLKLTIWDTAGQERFRTLTSSYYRGAQGIILVYDVTRRETFTNLSDVWAKEVELYLTDQDCVKMLVGNKVDRESERAVSREDGIALAKKLGSLFLECSAKTRENVEKCFEELAIRIMEVPSFLEQRSTVIKRNILRQKQEEQAQQSGGCCS